MSAEAVRVVEELQQGPDDPGCRRGAGGRGRGPPDPQNIHGVRGTRVRGRDGGPGVRLCQAGLHRIDGFREAWKDWTSAFEGYRIEIDDMIDAGEKVVSLVSMTGEIAGNEISAPGAAVWTVVDGRVRRVEFHLDQDAAMRAAGLEPR